MPLVSEERKAQWRQMDKAQREAVLESCRDVVGGPTVVNAMRGSTKVSDTKLAAIDAAMDKVLDCPVTGADDGLDENGMPMEPALQAGLNELRREMGITAQQLRAELTHPDYHDPGILDAIEEMLKRREAERATETGQSERASTAFESVAEDLQPDPFMDRVEAALSAAAKLRHQRGQDYGREKITVPDYMPFGDVSYLQMVWVKVMRLRSLVGSQETDRSKLTDSILDAINYLAFWAADIETPR